MMSDVSALPSAPPAAVEVVDGSIHYPSIDRSPIDFSLSSVENLPPSSTGGGKAGEGGDEETCCVVCLDVPVEGACVPCRHMAGCMSFLEKIKAKKSGCPVCLAKIDQVIWFMRFDQAEPVFQLNEGKLSVVEYGAD